MEDSVRTELGPQYGFDIYQMNQHYQFFRSLRKEHPVLQQGGFLPLHIKPSTLRVLSFCRYDKGNIFLVIASFESEPQRVSLCLDELLIPIYNMSMMINHSYYIVTTSTNGLWIVHNLREDSTCMVNQVYGVECSGVARS